MRQPVPSPRRRNHSCNANAPVGVSIWMSVLHGSAASFLASSSKIAGLTGSGQRMSRSRSLSSCMTRGAGCQGIPTTAGDSPMPCFHPLCQMQECLNRPGIRKGRRGQLAGTDTRDSGETIFRTDSGEIHAAARSAVFYRGCRSGIRPLFRSSRLTTTGMSSCHRESTHDGNGFRETNASLPAIHSRS